MVPDDQGLFVLFEDIAALRAEWEEELLSDKAIDALLQALYPDSSVGYRADIARAAVRRALAAIQPDAQTEQGGEQSGS